jgi:class 3 adenylate cyclase
MTPLDARFRRHPLWLTFADPRAEAAWRADFGAEHRDAIRMSIALFVPIFSAFALNDWFIFRDNFRPLEVIRFVGVVFPLCLAWALAGGRRGADLFSRHTQEFLLGMAIVVCGGMLGMSLVLAPGATPVQIWFAGLGYQLALVGIYGYSRLRFAYAVPIGLATTFFGLWILSRTPPGGPPAWILGPFGLVMNLAGAWMTRTIEVLGRRAFAERQLLDEARARSEALLRNVLPASVAERLHDGGPRAAIAEGHPEVTVVLADVVGFTPLCERLDANALAELLDRLYSRFDALCEAHGVEKIKTLGDAWLAAAGVPTARPDHAHAAARLALALRDVGGPDGPPLRIGLHTGPAVAGVIGRTRFAYDLWGDAVSGAQAMERASRPGGVRVSPETARRLRDRFDIVEENGGLWLTGERGAGPTLFVG